MQNWEAASRKNKAKLLYLPVVIRKIKFVYDSIRLGHYRLEPFFEIGASSTSNVFDSFIFVFSIILGSVLFSCLDIVCWRWRWKEMEVGQLFPLRCCCCCAFSVPVYLFLLLISFAITIGLYTISWSRLLVKGFTMTGLTAKPLKWPIGEMLKSDYFYETQLEESRPKQIYTTSTFCFANLFTGELIDRIICRYISLNSLLSKYEWYLITSHSRINYF